MLIKQAEDPAALLAALEARSAKPGATITGATADLAKRKAGLKGEAESSYLINFDFASSPNWAVLHDLRLEHGTRTAQIDHLLINRWLEFFVLETKHFNAGIKINEDGEFLRWNSYKNSYEGMASPLQQNERHIAVLSDVLGGLSLPTRLGMRIAPAFHSLVLVATSARIIRPERLDTSRVIKADQLKPRVWREIDDPNPVKFMLKAAARLVPAEVVETLGKQLAALHRPVGKLATPAPPIASAPALRTRKPEREESAVQTVTTPKAVAAAALKPAVSTTPEHAACKTCQGTSGDILYGKFGYYFKCDTCAANTSIRFTCKPGHAPRLRKDGLVFHRECAHCATSQVFHRNRKDSAA